MEKRALIAVAISFVILLAYQYFFIKPMPQEVQNQPVVTEKDKTVPVETQPPSVPSPSPVALSKTKSAPSEEKEVKIETELYSAVLTTKGATIKRYELKKYKDNNGKNVLLLKNPGLIPPLSIGTKDDFELRSASFRMSSPGGERNMTLDKNNTSGTLVFEYADSGFSIKRSFTFYHDSFKVDIKDEVSGLPEYWITTGTDFGIYDNKDTSVHYGPVLLKETDRLEFDPNKLSKAESFREGLKWIAQEDKYFFASLVPITTMEEARVWKIKDSPIIAFKGKSGTNSFILYAGPKEYDNLKTLKVGLEHIVDFGFFSILAIPLFWVLKIFYNLTANYGWAIILLTIVTRIPFIPLIHKSQKSMKKMQEIQPRMAEIKEKYKKDPQRMQKEMMAIYKTHKVNPIGGCLPILLQIPVFFALYKILLIAIELRNAPFMLWIQDLSAPDTLFGHIPAAIPLIGGFAVGPLPIVMGITMVIQQKMTPTSLDPTQNKIMMLMPVVFTFLFLNFASGLVLYWLMNNLFSIAQQFYANKKLQKEAASAQG
ncbi:MAG: membrane protein insertase YidC [Nitrospira sp.]|nr:membrane protein insertase YidC [Nitrospira sp.]